MKSDSMMRPIQIFVEGDSDIQLIRQVVKHWFGYSLKEEELKKSNGWTTIQSNSKDGEEIRQQMKYNSDNGGVNLIIFDADKELGQRRSEVLQWKNDYNLDFELFLFPDNQSNGAVEDLLMKCINPKNQPIVDCWKSHVTCLKTKKIENRNQPLTIPARKSEVYCYLETLLGETNKEKELIKDKNRNFLNSDHWDMDCPDIQSLKDFLQPYFE